MNMNKEDKKKKQQITYKELMTPIPDSPDGYPQRLYEYLGDKPALENFGVDTSEVIAATAHKSWIDNYTLRTLSKKDLIERQKQIRLDEEIISYGEGGFIESTGVAITKIVVGIIGNEPLMLVFAICLLGKFLYKRFTNIRKN